MKNKSNNQKPVNSGVKNAVIANSTKNFSRTSRITSCNGISSESAQVLPATSYYDPSTPVGRFMQSLEVIQARFDKDSRRQFIIKCGKAALRKGRWISKVPRGYDQDNNNRVQPITINNEGWMIAMAYNWKGVDKISNAEIIHRLKEMGFIINKQKLCEMFANPFYCGLMCHKYLNYAPVPGNYPQIVSEEVFNLVNNPEEAGSEVY